MERHNRLYLREICSSNERIDCLFHTQKEFVKDLYAIHMNIASTLFSSFRLKYCSVSPESIYFNADLQKKVKQRAVRVIN